MLKRLGVLGVVAAVVALAMGPIGPAAGSRGGDDHRTITVLSVNTEEEFIDVGTPDFSLGDAFVFTSQLTKHGTQVGHTGVVCTITSVVNEESQCVGTAWFDNKGQITIQGLVAGEPERFKFPITGGSGAYRGAEGVLVVRELSDTEELLTFRLSD